MTNKVLLQIIGGALLFFSFFNNWIYFGGFNYVKPMELISEESSDFTIKMLILVPILAVVLLYFGFQKAHSKKLTIASIVLLAIPAYNFYRGIQMNNELKDGLFTRHLEMEIGYFMCLIGLGALLVSLFVKEKLVNLQPKKDTSA